MHFPQCRGSNVVKGVYDCNNKLDMFHRSPGGAHRPPLVACDERSPNITMECEGCWAVSRCLVTPPLLSMHVERPCVHVMQVQRGFGDIPVLKAIANRFGASAFFNTVLVSLLALMTHRCAQMHRIGRTLVQLLFQMAMPCSCTVYHVKGKRRGTGISRGTGTGWGCRRMGIPWLNARLTILLGVPGADTRRHVSARHAQWRAYVVRHVQQQPHPHLAADRPVRLHYTCLGSPLWCHFQQQLNLPPPWSCSYIGGISGLQNLTVLQLRAW